jgi:beta-glucosidase
MYYWDQRPTSLGTHPFYKCLVRSPLGGRGFESFSEDPLLNGKIAAAYIRGVQKQGIIATMKHLVANDQETDRYAMSSNMTERTLREVYLLPFQIALREAGPRALMTAYNKLNGLHASENTHLLQHILRKEWGYGGLVMSDW